MKITFEIGCGLVYNQGPSVEVCINDQQVTDQTLTQENLLEYTVDNTQDTVVKILHKNKTDRDTVVIDNEIVADKWLKVTNLWVDDILLNNILCTTDCADSDVDRLQSDSLYLNGYLMYQFPKDFFNWYYEFIKNLDLQYIKDHADSEAEQKYLGYNQESSALPEIHQILESRGYSITS